MSKEEQQKREEEGKARHKALEQAQREAERASKERAESLRKQEEDRKRAEDEARKAADKKAREDAARIAKEEEARRKGAERKAKADAEAKRKEEEEARNEAERKAKEQAAIQKRQEEEKRRVEEDARKQAERRAREEAEAKRKAEEEARGRAEQARREAVEAEKRRAKEEEARKKESAERAKVLEKQKQVEEEKAREEAEIKRREDERARKEAEDKARVEADMRRREEAERARQLREQQRLEAEKARQQAEARRREEEARARQLEAQKKLEEEKTRRKAELKRREDEEARKTAERKAKEDADRKREEDEEKARRETESRRQEEQAQEKARRDAERKAEQDRKEAEKSAREEAERARQLEKQSQIENERMRKEAEMKQRQEEEAKKQADRVAQEAERQKINEEEARQKAEEVKAKQLARQKQIEEEKARRDAELKRGQEEEAKKKAEQEARQAAIKKQREEELKRKIDEQEKREAEKKAGELAAQQRREDEQRARQEAEDIKRREEARRTELKEKAKEEERLRKEQEREAKRREKGVVTPGGFSQPMEKVVEPERRRQQREISTLLKKTKVRSPTTGTPIPPAWKTIEKYPVNSPFAYAVIAQSPLGVKRYFLDEVPLTSVESWIYSYLLEALEDELTVPRSEVNPRQFFSDQARKILLKYSIIIPSTSWAKIIYFAERDLVGFGVIDGLMRDPNIEDISIDAVNKPMFIYHKGHESLETNITLSDDDSLDNLVTRLSHMAGKHVSTAFPIVQGTLPGRHRLVATFRREVSPQGSTATIRKFREDPLTIIDMLNLGVLDHTMAAYIWLMMQNRSTGLVVGATGAGKTTLLNALITLTRLNTKVVTIEEVQEINISHLNWTSLVSRESYAVTEEKAGSVDLFELVKAAMRMRPDILVVGEVRGEEAYVLFQAVSSVTSDTPVLVHENGETTLKPISDIVDRYYPGDAERVPMRAKGLDVLTFDRSNRVVFKPVNYVLRHKADEIYKVRYNGGEVKATGSHSVFVLDENCDLVEKPVSSLKEGDMLASFDQSQAPREEPVVDAESVLKRLVPGKLMVERVMPACPRCNSKRTWKRGMNAGVQNYTCKDCRRSFSGAMEGLVYANALLLNDGTELLSFTNSLALPKRIPVDEQFAKVLGIYMADGCVKHHRGSRIVFSLGTPEKGIFIDDLLEFFAKFGAEPTIDDRGTYSIIEFNHTPLALVFEDLCGRELWEKRIPSFMWDSPRPVVDAFLAGWTADARRTLKGKVESYSSARPDLVSAISWLARLNGRTTIITGRGSKYPSANISRPGVEQRSKAIPVLPLLKLKKMLSSTAWFYGPDPRKLVVSKTRARKALQDILLKKKSPLSWETAKLSAKISSLLDSSLIAAPVLSVTKSKYDGFVYDLSVPGTEAFFGGDSPVALHNTGHGGVCLPPTEKMLVSVADRPNMMTIEELYSREADKANLVRVGEQEIAPTREPVMVPSYDTASNRMTWSTVRRLSRRKYEGKLLTFRVRGGNQATTTVDHPLLVMRNGSICRVPAKEVRQGDLAPCVSELPQQFLPTATARIDLIEEAQRGGLSRMVTVRFVKDLLYSKKKGELASILRVPERSVDDYRKKDYLPLRKYLLLKDENRSGRYVRFRKSPHVIPAMIPVNRDLARLIGYYLAEGHTDGRAVDFSFNTNEAEFIREVREGMVRIFSLRLREVDRGSSTQVVVKDRLLSWVFTSVLRMGSRSEDKSLPPLIFDSAPELQRAVLDTYFLGDGCAFLGKDGRALVQATTASDELAYGIYYLMLSLGYRLNIGVDKRYDNWELTVSGGENFRRFVEDFEIGSSLRGLVVKGTPGVAEKVPIEYALKGGSRQLLRTRQAEGNRFVSKQVMERLGLQPPRGVFFAPVTSITELDYSGYVYDLYEVEGSHNFMHGFGMITSNCTLHGDDTDSAMQRLTSAPMNVPPAFIPFLDLSFVIRRMSVPTPGGGVKSIRRIVSIDEVINEKAHNTVFSYDPRTDTFRHHSLEKSIKIQNLAAEQGVPVSSIIGEIERRAVVLRWLQQRGIRNFREISSILELFASKPEETYERATMDLQVAGITIPKERPDET